MNLDEIDRQSFLINGSPKEIIKILGKDFLLTRTFIKQKDCQIMDTPIWILRYKDTFNNQVILAFGKQRNDDNKCILATLAFHMDLSWVKKSHRASVERDSIVDNIRIRLSLANNNYSLIQFNTTDDLVSKSAFSFVDIVTRSKIDVLRGFFKGISRFFKGALIATIIAFIILTGVYYYKIISNDTYIGVIIPTIIALIIEVGMPLKDELSRRKTDWFEE